MPSEPLVQPLSRSNRTRFFWLLLVIFCITMPVFVFYAVGYRIDFGEERNITTVGGLYISAEADDIEMFVDEEPVVNMRLFQQAAYVQNLDAGMHRVHVQRDGLQTWVKELPVYPHIVTEAQAFNMPEIPQVRYIPEWLTSDGLPLYIASSASTTPFAHASTTNTIVATTTPIQSTYTPNSEYEYVTSLFAASSSVSASDTSRRAVDVFDDPFQFAETAPSSATETATTTQIFRDVRLYESDGDVYAEWTGETRNVPYYYCITYTSPATTTVEYGEHVYESIVAEYGTSTDLFDPALSGTRFCRDTIRIDRKRQEVQWFAFFPGTIHRVLMLLEDGLYVVEVDDRSWQNVQQLYSGEDLAVRVDGGQIYVFDGVHYFELITEIATP